MPSVTSISKAWTLALAFLVVVPAAVVLATAGTAPLGPAAKVDATEHIDREITVNITAVECPADYDNQFDDDVCLGYDGQIPGPTWVFEQGERVNLTVHHNVTRSVGDLEIPEALALDLATSRYTLHRHGVNVAACEDGVAQPRGTEICDSTLGPEGVPGPAGSITYTFETSFPGAWHYHDHALGLDAGGERDNLAGPMAEHRGLWGTFVVLEPGESTKNVFDLHLLDSGPNGGMGLNETIEAGERFDLVTTGLDDFPWTVTLTDPDGAQVGSFEIGPGVSRSFTVEDADPGTYTWEAQTVFLDEAPFEGEVTVQ